MYSLLYAGRTERVDIDTTDSKAGKIRYGGEGGILTVVVGHRMPPVAITECLRINHLQDERFQPLFSW